MCFTKWSTMLGPTTTHCAKNDITCPMCILHLPDLVVPLYRLLTHNFLWPMHDDFHRIMGVNSINIKTTCASGDHYCCYPTPIITMTHINISFLFCVIMIMIVHSSKHVFNRPYMINLIQLTLIIFCGISPIGIVRISVNDSNQVLTSQWWLYVPLVSHWLEINKK